MPGDSIETRLHAVESRLAIGQLPIRYAIAVDARDVDAWVRLFVPEVRVGKRTSGRDALRAYIEPRRRERHWYAADVNERPQSIGFDSWHDDRGPQLPDAFPTWSAFWDPTA